MLTCTNRPVAIRSHYLNGVQIRPLVTPEFLFRFICAFKIIVFFAKRRCSGASVYKVNACPRLGSETDRNVTRSRHLYAPRWPRVVLLSSASDKILTVSKRNLILTSASQACTTHSSYRPSVTEQIQKV